MWLYEVASDGSPQCTLGSCMSGRRSAPMTGWFNVSCGRGIHTDSFLEGRSTCPQDETRSFLEGRSTCTRGGIATPWRRQASNAQIWERAVRRTSYSSDAPAAQGHVGAKEKELGECYRDESAEKSRGMSRKSVEMRMLGKEREIHGEPGAETKYGS